MSCLQMGGVTYTIQVICQPLPSQQFARHNFLPQTCMAVMHGVGDGRGVGWGREAVAWCSDTRLGGGGRGGAGCDPTPPGQTRV